MQGVIKSYDPGTKEGTLVRDTDRSEYELAADAITGSVFRMLRQGQRVVFDLAPDGTGDASAAGFGSRHGYSGFPGTGSRRARGLDGKHDEPEAAGLG